jgi:hypothetical protein
MQEFFQQVRVQRRACASMQQFDYLGIICATCTLGGLPELPPPLPSPRFSAWCVDDGAGGQGAGQWTYRVLPHG